MNTSSSREASRGITGPCPRDKEMIWLLKIILLSALFVFQVASGAGMPDLTPLEKAADEVGGETPYGIKGRSSLTGLTSLLDSGASLYYEGRLEEAILEYRKAQEMNPELTSPKLNLAVIYKDLGLYPQAIEEYKKALESSTDDGYVLKNLGLAYYLNGQLKEAIEVYKKAAKIEPEDPDVCFNLGRCFQEKGLLREAISQYRKAIEVGPDNALAYLNLGHIYNQIDSPGEAIQAYEKARDTDTGLIEIHRLLGKAHFKKGNFTKALTLYLRARAVEPENARLRHIKERIEEIYKRLGITEEERRIERRLEREKERSTPIQPIEEIEGVVNVKVGIVRQRSRSILSVVAHFE